MYFDRDGNPMEMEAWAKKFEDTGYRVIERTKLPDGRLVSTVWLGFDHGHGGRRLLFETMVFAPRGNGGPQTMAGDLDCERYSTEDEARAGHAEMVEKWSAPAPNQAETQAR